MYLTPPSVAEVSVNHIVGTAFATVIAAPGIDRRIRVAAISLGITRTSTGGVDNGVRGLTSLRVLGRGNGLSFAGTPLSNPHIPEPGALLDVNEALQLFATSTAATGASIVVVYYYTDAVS